MAFSYRLKKIHCSCRQDMKTKHSAEGRWVMTLQLPIWGKSTWTDLFRASFLQAPKGDVNLS
jgi:hypothetical protein